MIVVANIVLVLLKLNRLVWKQTASKGTNEAQKSDHSNPSSYDMILARIQCFILAIKTDKSLICKS